MQTALAESRIASVCIPAWRTTDVVTLARLARGGETDVLPILADALQDAGCDDERILDHCRDREGLPGRGPAKREERSVPPFREVPHTYQCWVPDLILDAEADPKPHD
jgi:hypothetical protein